MDKFTYVVERGDELVLYFGGDGAAISAVVLIGGVVLPEEACPVGVVCGRHGGGGVAISNKSKGLTVVKGEDVWRHRDL